MVEDSKEAENDSSHCQNHTRNPTGGDDFNRTIAKIAVAQICENWGFHGFQQSALEAFSDVVVRYLKELGKASNFYANLAGRSGCNVFDLMLGLEDLGFFLGFPGASDVHRPLTKSGVIREIGQYVNFNENVPFVFDVPRFRVCRECKLRPSFSRLGDEPPGEHIPAWLPAFPVVGNERDGSGSPDGNVVSVEVVKDSTWERHLSANERVEANVNPFLASPLQFSEKEIGLVDPPPRFFVRNHGDMMETYGGMSESDGVPKEVCVAMGRSVRSIERPRVGLNFSIVKTSLSSSDAVSRKKRYHKFASCFGIEEEKYENNSRVEVPLKETMEMRELDSTEL